MTRPKKDEQTEKIKEAQPITLDEFKQKSDQVVVALTELKEYTNIIISGYIKYTSNIFRGSAASHDEHNNRFEVLDLISHLNNTTASTNAGPARATTPGPTDVKKRKQREKKPKDPNAPKRPLTAYFLFAEHAREYIKKDMGEDTPNGDIQKEATRRWSVMPPEEKAEWRASYQRSYEQYKKDLAAYLASKGETVSAEERDQEMADAVAGAADPEAEGEAEIETSSEDEGLEEVTPKSPTPPPKAPSPPKEAASKTPKTNKRRKAAAQNGVPVPTPAAAVPAPSSPTPAAKQTRVPLPTNSSVPESTPQPKGSSPELKRKKKDSSEEPKRKRSRKSKGGEGSQTDTQNQPPPESSPPAAASAAEKKDKKRKRKSEAA